jgi:tetratricopeptide (TPR) repeat protein
MRRLRRLAAGRTPPSPRELRRAFLDALRDRVPALGTVGARAPLGAVLRRAGVTETTAQQADDLLQQLDAAAFSPAGISEPTLVARSASVAAAVDLQAVRPPRGSSAAPALLLAALLAAGSARALPDGVAHSFAQGVRAYERGDFASAQRLFARTAARAPRAANAWADLAAAAWMRADTAHAVVGWQRALRLNPLDGELRERLAALQPPLLGAPSYVPPVPLNLLAGAVLLLWGGAWILLALPLGRRPRQGRAIAGGAIAVAVVGLVAAIELADAADVRGLGALRGARGLLDTPTPGAGSAALAAAGEVGRLGAREGAWVRITLDRARAGWVPVAAVLALDADAGAD